MESRCCYPYFRRGNWGSPEGKWLTQITEWAVREKEALLLTSENPEKKKKDLRAKKRQLHWHEGTGRTAPVWKLFWPYYTRQMGRLVALSPFFPQSQGTCSACSERPLLSAGSTAARSWSCRRKRSQFCSHPSHDREKISHQAVLWSLGCWVPTWGFGSHSGPCSLQRHPEEGMQDKKPSRNHNMGETFEERRSVQGERRCLTLKDCPGGGCRADLRAAGGRARPTDR